MVDGRRVDSKVEAVVPTVEKEQFARVARKLGFRSSSALLRSLVHDVVTIGNSLPASHVNLSSKK